MGVIEYGTGTKASRYVRSPLGAASNSGVGTPVLARSKAWIVRAEPEVIAGALVVLWLALEAGWRWRRLRAWWVS